MFIQHDAIVIGAGFYGLMVALRIREKLRHESVLVLERNASPMAQASLNNQARVHNGYHYPRSLLTGARSRTSRPRFVEDFPDAIVDSFTHYYAIAKFPSKTNSRQFETFCNRIGASWRRAPSDVLEWFDLSRISSVYEVEEPAFDSGIVRDMMLDRISRIGGIELSFDDEVTGIKQVEDLIHVESTSGSHTSKRLINATYAGLNRIHEFAGAGVVPVQQELTEMALVVPGEPIGREAITVMDGPFFSLMPFPSRGLHTLSHVRYTPHGRWFDRSETPTPDPYRMLESHRGRSSFVEMKADVLRYVPALASMVSHDSLWEVKTVLTRSDRTDSRPILFRSNEKMTGMTSVLGGKIDNVYDVLEEIENYYGPDRR